MSDTTELMFKRVITGYCLGSFSWMLNKQNQDPCVVTGYLIDACTGGDSTFPPLSNGSTYRTPNTLDATQCFCSWAAYNTLQACALCQSAGGPGSVLSWRQYNPNCTGVTPSNSYFPQKISIPPQTAIPYWATENPNSWPNGKFGGPAAKNLASQGVDDITEQSRKGTNSKKKSNTGAIVGGVIGGLLFLAVIGLFAFFWRRKKRKSRSSSKLDAYHNDKSTSNDEIHEVQRGGNGQEFNLIDSPKPTHPTTYDPSSNYGPYPYDASLIAGISPPPDSTRNTSENNANQRTIPTMMMSTTPAARNAHTRVPSSIANGSIQPFILPPTLPEPMGPNQSGKTGRNVYRPDAQSQERLNPPAYSEVDHSEASADPISVEEVSGESQEAGTNSFQGTATTSGTHVVQNDNPIEEVAMRPLSQPETGEHGFPADRKRL